MSKELVIIIWGGIGDVLVSTPAIRALKESYPDRKIIIYCGNRKQCDVFNNNPYVSSVRLLNPWKLLKYPYHLYVYLFNRKKIKYYQLFFQYIPLSWIYEKSVKEIVPEIFRELNVVQRINNVQLFFTESEERWARKKLSAYSKVVIMHIHSRSSVNHHWLQDRWKELVKTLPDYTFIQIGNNDEPYVDGALDWRGKTTLREGFCLLKYASSFVGVDSSFAHATNAFNLPGVVLFGDTSPVHWGHDNNINIYKKVRCGPCYYDLAPDKCPYDNECMKLITVEEVRDALMKQVEAGQSIPVEI